MTQKTVYLSLTITRNEQCVTLPLTPLLFAMWLMVAFPTLANLCQQVNQFVTTTDAIVASTIIGVLTVIMGLEVKLCYS